MVAPDEDAVRRRLVSSPAMSIPDHDPALVDNTAALRDLVSRLRDCSWLALDTEFIREDTYWPRLCLIQVANDELVACIDPLALDDLDPLAELLYDPAITKVLHAAGQDLEIFHHLHGRLPAPLFDTQVAAPLLGHADQAGFATLVRDILAIELDKGHARTDWTERPLPAAALAYAADDVRYLVPLYHRIRDELERRNRLQWLDRAFDELADPARFERPPEDAWRRLRGVDRLPPSGRAVARALAGWREQNARDRNVPRGRVLRDDALLEIAKVRPRDRKELGRMRSLRGGIVEREGETLLRLVAEARDSDAPVTGERAAKVVLDAHGEALVDVLTAVVRLHALAGDLNPGTIAGRRELARIATGEPPAAVLAGWRAALIGDDLEAIVDGRTVVGVDAGRLTVMARTGD